MGAFDLFVDTVHSAIHRGAVRGVSRHVGEVFELHLERRHFGQTAVATPRGGVCVVRPQVDVREGHRGGRFWSDFW